MSGIQLFDFNGSEIRVVMIDGNPWFVGSDIAKVLDYSEPARMLQLVDDDDKQVINPQKVDSTKIVESFGSNTFKVSVLNESGMYAVIFGSTKLQAKAFKRWVTSDVLPSIRKTGGYSVSKIEQAKLPPHKEASEIATEIRYIKDTLTDDPRLCQFLVDYAISSILEQKTLGSIQYRGVVEIAQELGFKLDLSSRGSLGKFVKSQLPHLAKSEKRLVNGTMRDVACYPDTEEVREMIKRFFN